MAPSFTRTILLDALGFQPSQNSTGIILLYYGASFVVIVSIVYIVYTEVGRYLSRIPKLPGPYGLPLFGSLPWLWGKVHAEQFRIWSKQYGPVFQVQLGARTAVVVNSASAARALFLGQREAMNSRPLFYVLHGKVQENSPVTSIGTSPWNDSCKRRRKAGATAMNKVSVDSYQPVSINNHNVQDKIWYMIG
jgi:3-hydroxyphenylacetate 6-hydroxylase